jgi:hypothetical protein
LNNLFCPECRLLAGRQWACWFLLHVGHVVATDLSSFLMIPVHQGILGAVKEGLWKSDLLSDYSSFAINS